MLHLIMTGFRSKMDPDMSFAQCDLIFLLLEGRRVSRQCAERIITMLMEQPPMNDTGIDTLKQIQNPK